MKLFNNQKLEKEPKVSIILPNYNSSKTIVSTINSIIQQKYKHWELIIIDDCSDRTTKNILSKYKKIKKIKIFYLKKNRGAAYCRNLAIKKTKSYYIAFKNKYSIKKTILVPKEFNFDSFVRNTSIATSTMIVKRSITNKIKFSNTKICEDYYYKCQLLKRIGSAYCYPSCLTEYQIRNDSLQSSRIRNLYWIWKINKSLNQLNILSNLISILFISYNSLKKYGFR